jgi:hypothetical protein
MLIAERRKSETVIRELAVVELEAVAGGGTGPANPFPRPPCPCHWTPVGQPCP